MPFYAVREGVKPGIYSTWDECKVQITGYKGARYKKFSTREEAEEFVSVGKKEKVKKNLEVYTDGSSDQATYASCAFVVVENELPVHTFASRLEAPFTNSHGEVVAILMALRWMKEKEKRDFNLFSDSEFCVKTVNDYGRTRSEAEWQRRAYHTEFREILQLTEELDCDVHHIDAHSGHRFNEMADRLARDAVTMKESSRVNVITPSVKYLYTVDQRVYRVLPFLLEGDILKVGIKLPLRLVESEEEVNDSIDGVIKEGVITLSSRSKLMNAIPFSIPFRIKEEVDVEGAEMELLCGEGKLVISKRSIGVFGVIQP